MDPKDFGVPPIFKAHIHCIIVCLNCILLCMVAAIGGELWARPRDLKLLALGS